MEKETKKQKDKTNADTKPKKDKKEDNKKEDKKEDKNKKEVVVNETNNNSNINSKNKKEKIELDSYVDYIKKITDSKKLILHCWRGGKRSSSMAWLLELFDYEIIIIQNGYKSYRNFVLKYLESVISMVRK